MKARSIAVVSVSRSDYGHLLPVLEAIRDAEGLALRLVVGGMHLVPEFGHTVRAIEADGWAIDERVEMHEPDDTPAAVGAAIGRGVAGFARAWARLTPDLVLVLGDRFEMLAAALAALPFALPVAHVHGGEVTEGAIDNQIRHAITKLAHLHFASAAPHARRLLAMGEEPWRVHTVGAPGLDRLARVEPLSRDALAATLRVPSATRWLLVTYHPVTLEYREAAAQVEEVLAALEKVDATPILTAPAADTAGRSVLRRLEEFAARQPRAAASREGARADQRRSPTAGRRCRARTPPGARRCRAAARGPGRSQRAARACAPRRRRCGAARGRYRRARPRC